MIITLTKALANYTVIDFEFIDLDYRYYIALHELNEDDQKVVNDIINEVLTHNDTNKLVIEDELRYNVNLNIYHTSFNHFDNINEKTISVNVSVFNNFLELCLRTKVS